MSSYTVGMDYLALRLTASGSCLSTINVAFCTNSSSPIRKNEKRQEKKKGSVKNEGSLLRQKLFIVKPSCHLRAFELPSWTLKRDNGRSSPQVVLKSSHHL